MIACFVVSYLVNQLFEISFGTFLLSTVLSLIILLSAIYFVGLNKKERGLVQQLVMSKLHKK